MIEIAGMWFCHSIGRGGFGYTMREAYMRWLLGALIDPSGSIAFRWPAISAEIQS